MELQHKIEEAYTAAENYPDLVIKLIAIGVESYTVDASTTIILYRMADGVTVLHGSNQELRTVAERFSESGCKQAVKNNQQGQTDFPGFMDEIAVAGVRFYEATLTGLHKRVQYIGVGGSYEELIVL